MQPSSAPAAGSGAPFPTVPEVIFANWREALHQSGLSPGLQSVYALARSDYLEYCSRNGVSMTTVMAPLR